MIPVASVFSALVKLITSSFRHPTHDADIVVRDDGHVDVVDVKPEPHAAH